MPELPEIQTYIEALRPRILSQPIERIRLASPFLVRSVAPPISAATNGVVTDIRRLGKRIVIGLDTSIFLVFHLMIAGRFRWERRGARPPGRVGAAAVDFPTGTLVLIEAGTKKRASLYLVHGEPALAAHDPGGIEVLDASVPAFAAALHRERHTLKRALTDPTLFSGIGNAYSDEILHAAGLSPVRMTDALSEEEVVRLHAATQRTLRYWIAALREQLAGRFPKVSDITAFRPGFAAHGRYRQPCPVCSTAIQRIRYAENETNYCPRCQTSGRVLADRSLSRLLKDDWPRSIDELETLYDRSR